VWDCSKTKLFQVYFVYYKAKPKDQEPTDSEVEVQHILSDLRLFIKDFADIGKKEVKYWAGF